jgi:S-adenosylmethionine:tRNA ribosyltransferase-isomerase
MNRADFSYELPRELIAQQPRERGRSRMMMVVPTAGRPVIHHSTFEHFADLLGPADVLVLNDTRVFPARLYAEPKGSMKRPIEILLAEQRAPLLWECWCKPARRVRNGDLLRFSPVLAAVVEAKRKDGTVLLRFETGGDFWSEVERIGITPLPPYIVRTTPQTSDREAYQTVYAAERGAIAAPTAGLHFTQAILDEIDRKGVDIARITLHVGTGTFSPVTVDDIADHRMASERYEISPAAAATINAALAEGRTITAVGTTTTRALESAALTGDGRIRSGRAETSLFITPGFRFRVVNRLLTNFHLPESTLLILVTAFAGATAIREAYAEAIRERYLFYSFGDCMVLDQKEALTADAHRVHPPGPHGAGPA